MNYRKKTIIGLLMALLFATSLLNAQQVLSIKFEGEEYVELQRYFKTLLPESTVEFSVAGENIESIFVSASKGNLMPKGDGVWKYESPKESGNYELKVEDAANKKTIIVSMLVLVPRTEMKGEYLNGYRIGNYPEENYKGRNNYKKPDGFIEITEENKNLYITPHFQLKQFLCKQSSGWPKYLVIHSKLILKLEHILSILNKQGLETKTLFIMSGYRTPYYNKAIGNVKYSRHIYGDAADIYVDDDLDGVFDDMNNDGKSTMDDALIIHEIVNNYEADPENEHFVGGMGKYNKNSAHTYFIHIDTRGYKARW